MISVFNVQRVFVINVNKIIKLPIVINVFHSMFIAKIIVKIHKINKKINLSMDIVRIYVYHVYEMKIGAKIIIYIVLDVKIL